VSGRHDSTTAYFWGRSGWGGRLVGPCYVPRPVVRDDKGKDDDEKPDQGEDKPKDPGDPKPPDPSPSP
jgi:hypothetical protein